MSKTFKHFLLGTSAAAFVAVAASGAHATTGGDQGSSQASSGNVTTTANFTGDFTLTLATTHNITATPSVTTATTNTGTLAIAEDAGDSAIAIAGQIGTATNALKAITFTTSDADTVTFSGAVYTRVITVTGANAASNIVFTENVGADTGFKTALNIAGNFAHNIKINKAFDGSITTSNNGVGIVTLNASGASVSGSIGVATSGLVASVAATEDSTVTGNIHATAITITDNKTLSIGDGATLTGTGINGSADGAGTLKLLGAATIASTIGQGNDLDYVTLNGASKTVTLQKTADADVGVVFNADGTLLVDSNGVTITTPLISTTTTNTGTLKTTVTTGQTTTIAGEIGTSSLKLKSVEVGGLGTLTTNGNVYSTGVLFSADGVAQFTGATKTVSGAVTTSTTNTGTLDVNGATTFSGQIGTSAAKLKLVDMGAATTFSSNVHATETKFTAGTTAAITDGITIDGAVTTSADNQGTVNIAGDATFTGNVGASAVLDMGTINIDGVTANEVVAFQGNVWTNAYDATGSKSTVYLSKDKTLTSGSAINAAAAGSAVYKFGLDNNSTAKIATAAGGVDLTNATIEAFVDGTGFIANGTTYTVVDAAAASALPTTTTITDNSAVLTFTAALATGAAANSDIVLTATRTNRYDGLATTTQTRAAGAALEAIGASAVTTSKLGLTLAALDAAANATAVNAILNTLDPEVDGSLSTATSSNSVQSLSTVETRLASLRNGTAGVATGDMGAVHGAWVQAFGSNADQDMRKGIAGYDADTYGFTVGADTMVDDVTRVGVAFSYADTDVDSKDTARNKTEIGSYQLTAYGSRDMMDGYYIDGMLGVAWNDYETTRNISAVSAVARGDFDGMQYTAKVGGGYNVDLGRGFDLEPKVGLRYSYIDFDNYTETGAGNVGLNVSNDEINIFEASIGANLGYTFKEGSTLIRPNMHAQYAYDFVGDEASTTSSFIGFAGNSFRTTGADAQQSRFNIGAGVEFLRSDNITFTADYDAELKDEFVAHTGMLRARFGF